MKDSKMSASRILNAVRGFTHLVARISNNRKRQQQNNFIPSPLYIYNSNTTPITQKQQIMQYQVAPKSANPFLANTTKLFSFLLLTTLFAVSFFSNGVKAQSIANYTFSAATNGSLQDLSSGATTIMTGNNDAASTTVNPIGFNFVFMGVSYTHFSANSDGQMRLHTSSGATAISTGVTSVAASTVTLAAMTGDNEVNNGIRYKVIGTAPNRIFVLEWNQFYGYYTPNITNAGNMQAWLYETTGKISFAYGEIYNTSTAAISRSIFIASSNTATTVSSVTVGSPSTASASATLTSNSFATGVTASTATTGTTLIPNLGSSADGSRVVFSWTPPASAPTDPSSLTFASVSKSGMTANWLDNSTSESGFILTRADDAAFTTNVVTTSFAANIVTSGALTGLIPGNTYYFKVQAYNEAQFSGIASGSQATTSASTITSAATGIWSATATWVGGVVPTATDNVLIADGHTVTIDGTTATCNNLTVGGGTSGVLQHAGSTTASTITVVGSVTVASGGAFNVGTGTGNHTVNIGGSTATALGVGSLIVNGTFSQSTSNTIKSRVYFYGSANATISGTGATCAFDSIIINKGTSASSILDVTRLITMPNNPTGTANKLTITAGTFKMSSASTISPYYGSQTICTSIGRLWMNNSGATISCLNSGTSTANTGAGSPTVGGVLQMDAGTFNYGCGNNTMTFTSGTGVLNMTGGTINMYGAVSFPSSALTQMNMSGGTINVNPNFASAAATSTTLFTLGSLTSVNWTGGDLVFVHPHSAAGGTAFSCTANTGTKVMNGTATVKLGTDSAYTVTGGTLGNTSGFGLTSAGLAINHLIVGGNNSIQSRMARLVGATYARKLTINTGGYLFTGSGTTTQTLLITDTLINNGTLAGCEPAGSQSIGTVQIGNQTAPDQSLVTGSGTFSKLGTLAPADSAGVVFNQTNQYVCGRVNAFYGNITNANKITIGLGSAEPTLQIGGSGSYPNRAGGVFDVAPTYNNGGYRTYLLYAQTAFAQSTGAEVPSTRSNIRLYVNNTNGLTVTGGALNVDTLQFVAGKINTTSTNIINVTGTLPASIVGQSSANYINGPMSLRLPSSLTTAALYTFPVGKAYYKPIKLVNPRTTTGGTVTVQAEVVDAATGGTPVGLIGLLKTNRYWTLNTTDGGANIDSIGNIRVVDTTAGADIIGFSNTTLNGNYDVIGGKAAVGTADSVTTGVTSGGLTKITAVTGYYVLANKAAATVATPAITPTGNQCTNTSRAISVLVTPGGGAVTDVALNYSINGVAQTAIAMTNSTGIGGLFPDTWVGTIPTVTPANANVTWSVTATDANGLTKSSTGTAYQDEPNFGSTATATATNANICTGTNANLSVAVTAPGGTAVMAGTTTTASSYSNPFYSNWANARTQILITAADLAASGLSAGNITKISIPLTSTSTTTRTGFTLKLAHTTTTGLTTTAFEAPTFTTVYSADFTPAVGNNVVTFSTPFNWNGTSNLLMEFCWDNTASTSTISTTATAVTAGYTCAISYNRTSTTGTSICGATNTPTTSYTTRPQFTFTGVAAKTPTSFSWSNGTTEVGTTNPLSITLNGTTSYTATSILNSCPVVSNAVTVTAIPLPTSPTKTDSIHCGAGLPKCSVAGGTGNNYRWYLASTGGVALVGEDSSVLRNYSINTTTTFYVSIYDGTCESIRTAVTETVIQPDSINATSRRGGAICLYGSDTLDVVNTAATPIYNYSYAWRALNGNSNSGIDSGLVINGSTINITPLVAATYNYEVVASDGGCVYKDTVSVLVRSLPVISSVTSSPSTVCAGSDVVLQAKTPVITPGDATFGAGASNTTSSTLPLYYYYGANKVQYIYTAAELTAQGFSSGNITALSLFAATAGGSQNYKGFNISMGTTTSTGFTTGQSTGLSGLTTVYTGTGNGNGIQTVVGANNFVFQTPFYWNGTSNIVVSICYSNNTTLLTSTYWYYDAAASGNPGWYLYPYAAVTANTMLNAVDVAGLGTTGYAYSTTNRPKTLFTGNKVAYTNGGFTWSWNPGAIAGDSVKVNPTTTTTYNATVTDNYGCVKTSGDVVVTVNPIPVAPVTTASTQCGTKVPGVSVATGDTTTSPTFNWYSVPSTPAPTTQYSNNFDDALVLNGATLTGSATITGGVLQLTPNTTSQLGGITIPASGVNADTYSISFKSITGTGGADGFSYNFGDDASATSTTVNAEIGSGTKLNVSFDDYGAGTGAAGIRVIYGSSIISDPGITVGTNGILAYSSDVSWVGTPTNFTISIDALGRLSVLKNGLAVLTNIQLPSAYLSANKSTWKHVIKGRTGGVSMLHQIDDLAISYQTSGKVATGAVLTSPISTTTTYYVAEISAAGCEGPRTSVTATVIIPDSIALSALDSSICIGQSAVMTVAKTSFATGNTYNYKWTANSTASGIADSLSGTTNTVTPSAPGTYNYLVTATDGECTAVSNVTVVVNGIPTVDSITANKTAVCDGDSILFNAYSTYISTGPQTLPTGYAASNATNAADEEIWNVTFGTLNNTSDCSTTAPGTGSVLNKYSNYTTSVAAPTVNRGDSVSVGFTLGFCGTGTYSNTAVVYIDWNRDGDFVDAGEAAIGKAYGSYALTGASYVGKVKVPDTASLGQTMMRVVLVEATTISPTGTYTYGETEDYVINIQNKQLVNSALTYTWNPGEIVGSSRYITPTSSALYSVTVNDVNGCTATSSTIPVAYNLRPAAPTATDSTQCGTGAPLAMVSGAGSFNWYNAATGGTLLQGGASATYNTPISATTTFYVSSTDASCESATRTPVTETVTTPPVISISAGTTLCSNGITAVSVTSNLSDYSVYKWSPVSSLYKDSLATDPYTTNDTTLTTVYFKSPTLGDIVVTLNGSDPVSGCHNTATRTMTVLPSTASVTTADTVLCGGGQATLFASPDNGYGAGSIQWQVSSDNITFADSVGATGTLYVANGINAVTYFRVVVKDAAGNTCFASPSTMVNVPGIVATAPGTRCGPGAVTLGATGSLGSTVKWYDVATGGTSLATGNTYTGTISSTKTFYATANYGNTAANVGKAAPEATSTGYSSSSYGLDFTLTSGITLNNVQVFSTTGTSITISLYSSGGSTQLQTTGAVAVTAGTSPTINLGWTIPAGTYRLVANGMTGNFIRDNTNTTYPFALGTVGTMNGFVSAITGTVTTTASYYFMYNWNISVGCESARTPVVATSTTPPSITATSAANAVCLGNSTTVTVSSENAGYSYSWTGSLNGVTQTVTPTATTTYTVNAVDSTGGANNGCTATSNVTVTVNPLPNTVVPTATPSKTVCVGGSVTLGATANSGQNINYSFTENFEGTTFPPTGWTNLNNGTGNSWISGTTYKCNGANSMQYSYNSSNAADAWMITPAQNLVAGVTYTISFNYKGYGSTTLPEKMKLTVGSASTVVAQSTTLLDLNPITTSACTVGTATFTPTTTGTYYFGFNCYSIANAWYLGVDDISITGTQIIPVSTFSWSSNPAGFSASTQTAIATPTAATTYTVRATNSLGCYKDSSINITMNTLAVSAVNTENVKCNGQSNGKLTATATGGTAPYQYSLDGITFQSSNVFSGLAAGNYTIYAKDNNSPNCTVSGNSVTIAQPEALAFTSDNSNPVCNNATNGSIVVHATGGTAPYQYKITGGVFGSDSTFATLSSGSYTLTVRDANSCSASSNVTLTNPAKPSVSASNSTTAITCAGSNVTLRATDGYAGYAWTGPSGVVINNASDSVATAVAPSNGDKFYVTISDVLGCTNSDSTTVSITANQTVSVSVSAFPGLTITTGEPLTFTATPTNGGSAPQYAWFVNDTQVPDSTGPTFTSDAFNDQDQVRVQLTSSLPCTVANPVNSATQTVTVVSLVFVSVDSLVATTTTACAGTSVTYTAYGTGGGPGATYEFFVNETSVQNSTSPTYTYVPSNGDQVYVIMTSSYTENVIGNPATSGTVAMTVNPIPSAPTVTASGDTTFCAGGSVTLTSSYTGGNLWSNGATTDAITVSASGNYTVTYTSPEGCTSAASQAVQVTANANPVVSISGSSSLCSNSSTTLTATATAGSGTVSTFAWTLNGTTSLGTASTQTASLAGSYTVTVTNSNGCSTTSNGFTLSTVTAPVAGITADCNPLYAGQTTTLTATPSTGVDYVWSLNGAVQSLQTTSTYAGVGVGSYKVRVTNINTGCVDSITFAVNAATGALAAGTYAIPSTCGGFTSISSAIDYLNTNGIANNGNVVFNVAAGYTETAPRKALGLTATGTSTSQIIFQKSGSGANPTINAAANGNGTPASAKLDGILKLVGSDYVTIDGFSFVDTAVTGNGSMEFAVGLFKASSINGSQYNTIKNCTITMPRVNNTSGTAPVVEGAVGIAMYNSNDTAATTAYSIANPVSPAGSNSYNKFYSNTINGGNYGMALIGFADTAASKVNADQGNDIGGSSAGTGNTIVNFGGATAAANPAAGIRTLAQYGLNISYNTINNNNGSGVNHPSTLRGIYTNTAVGASEIISNNTVTLTSGGTTSQLGGAIDNVAGSTGSGNTISIVNNIVNTNYPGATSGVTYAISNTAAPDTLNINNNTVTVKTAATSGAIYSINQTGSIVKALNINGNTFVDSLSATSTSSNVRMIFCSGGAATCASSISNNNFNGIGYTGSTGGTGEFSGIYHSGTPLSMVMSGNNFTNLSLKTTGSIYAMYNNYTAPANVAAFKTVQNNTINGFARTVSATTNSMYGYYDNSSSTTAAHTISGNSFSNVSNIASSSGGLYGIYSTDYSGNPGLNLYNNTINGMVHSGTGGLAGIYAGGFAGTATTPQALYGNSVTGIRSTSTSTSQYGILVQQSLYADVYNNTVQNDSCNGAAGQLAGIYTAGSSSRFKVYNNTVTNLRSRTSGATLGVFVSAGTQVDVFENNINNISSDSSSSWGVYVSGGTTVNVYNHKVIGVNNYSIYNISSSGRTGINTEGIRIAGGTTVNVYKNNVYNLSNTGVTTSTTIPMVNGISASGTTSSATVNIYNNMVSGLTAPAVSDTNAIRGIAITATGTTSTYNVSYNTVSLNGTSTGTNFGGTGLWHTTSTTATTAALNLRNNIIVNNITPKGTGKAVAYRRSSNTLTNYGSLSNNNLFYAGTPGANNLIYFAARGTDSIPTLAAYKTKVATRDAASISENPTFVSTTPTDATHLHINTSTATAIEGGGVAISGLNDDIDGDIRQGSTGYTGASTSGPDMGADEFEGTSPTCTGIPTAGSGIVKKATVCSANTTATFTHSGVTTGSTITYQWQVSTSSTTGFANVTGGTGANTPSYTTPNNLSAGTYYYTLVVTCGATSTADSSTLANKIDTLVVNANPVVTVTSNSPVCSGTTLSFTATSNPAGTYAWSGPGTLTGGTTLTPSIATVTTAAAGKYFFTATNAGCSKQDSVTVVVNESPSAVTVSPATGNVCTDAVQTLTASGGNLSPASILAEDFEGTTFPPTGWSAINAGTGNTWTQNTSSTYSCNGTKSAYVVYNTTNAANAWLFTPAQTLTAGVAYKVSFKYKGASTTYNEKIKLTVGSGNAVADQTNTLLDLPTITSTTCNTGVATFTPSTSGTYYFAFNCYSAANQFYAIVDSVNITYPVPAPSTTWSPSTELYSDAAATVPYAGENLRTVYAKPTVGRTYTATVTNNSCTASGTSVLTMKPRPTATLTGSVSSVCTGAASPSFTFTGAGGTAPYTFTYSVNGGSALTTTTTSGSSKALTISTSTPGVYSYKLISVSDAFCSGAATDSANITVVAPPTPSFTGLTTPVCIGTAPQTLTGNYAFGTFTGTGVTSNGDGTATFNPAVSGSSIIRYEVTTACTASTTQNVTVNPNVVAGTISGTQTVCIDRTRTFTVSGNTASGSWSSSDANVATVNSTTGVITGVAAGTATITYTINSGCGAPVSTTRDITVNVASTSVETLVACNSYIWHGTTYTTSNNTATWTGTNAVGCDSVVTLNLTINYTSSSAKYDTACNSYTWNGVTYTTSGIKTQTLTNAAGCDSTATVYLTIRNSTSSTQTLAVCSSYPWNGQTYTASGSYTYFMEGANRYGCDSTAVLNLTIKQPTSSTETLSACNSLEWHGTTYTESNNTATWTGVNAAGCDSVVTLNLTVNYSSTSEESASACVSYTWHGTTYSTSGDKVWHTTNAAGCDSAVTLHLTVTPQPTQPTGLACYQTATFNYTTCEWDVTGTQPAAPTGLACYQTATWNATTCEWDVTGTQPAAPTVACYQTATWNPTTCEWDVTGTQPAAPTGLACYQTATWNPTTCEWDVTGTQPAAPTVACYQTATWNPTTCEWDVTGTQPAAPTGLACYQTATWNPTTCEWDVTGTQPAAPTGLACYQTATWNPTTCEWDVTGTQPAAPNAGTNGTIQICSGTTITASELFGALGGTPEAGGSWTPTLAGAGVYTYTVTGSAPCSYTSSATVTVTEQTCFTTLNVKAYLEGFYAGNGTMASTLYDLGESTDATATDTIEVSLWSAASLTAVNATPDYTQKVILHTDGTASVQFPGATLGNSYYVAIKHRNSLETWSAATVAITSTTSYDFSTGLGQAYGDGINDPMKSMGSGVYAIYSGDVNQDGTIDISDSQLTENDANQFMFGYNMSDCNGDGASDVSDLALIQNNLTLFLFRATPQQ